MINLYAKYHHLWFRLYKYLHCIHEFKADSMVISQIDRYFTLIYRSWVPLCCQHCSQTPLGLLSPLRTRHHRNGNSHDWLWQISGVSQRLISTPIMSSFPEWSILHMTSILYVITSSRGHYGFHVSTKYQLADALSKPLARLRFKELMHKIGETKLPPSILRKCVEDISRRID